MDVEKQKEELLSYGGSSPLPEDFDIFWDKMLTKTKAMTLNISFEKAEYSYKNADAFHLYFDGLDGSRIHARYLRPKNAENAPVIFLFHGYGGASPDWVSLLPYVCEGFCVAALDCRGQAGRSQDGGRYTGNTYHGQLIRGLADGTPENLVFAKIFTDTVQLVRVVEELPEIDKNRMFTKGVSQGGGLALALSALCPQIKKVAVCFPFLSDYKRAYQLCMPGSAYSELKDYFRSFDPRHEREDEIFNLLGYIDVQNLSKYIKADVLMFTGFEDSTCPTCTQFAVYNKIKSNKKVYFYPDLGHEYLPESEEITLRWFEGGTW